MTCDTAMRRLCSPLAFTPRSPASGWVTARWGSRSTCTAMCCRECRRMQSPRLMRRCRRPGTNGTQSGSNPVAKPILEPEKALMFLGIETLVQRLLDPLRLAAIVLGTANLAARDFGENGAGAGQALAIDMARRIPQFRTHDGFGALIKHALHRDHDHRARRFAVDDEAFRKRRISGDAGAPDHPNSLADAGNEKQQRHPRITDNIAQRIDAIVAAAVRNEQRLFIGHAHKAGRVAAWRAIEPVRPASRQCKKRRRLDEFPIMRIDVVDLFDDRRTVGLTIERRQRFERGNAMIVALFHMVLLIRDFGPHAASNCRPS